MVSKVFNSKNNSVVLISIPTDGSAEFAIDLTEHIDWNDQITLKQVEDFHERAYTLKGKEVRNSIAVQSYDINIKLINTEEVTKRILVPSFYNMQYQITMINVDAHYKFIGDASVRNNGDINMGKSIPKLDVTFSANGTISYI